MSKTSIEYVLNPDGTPGFNWRILTGCLHPCSKLYCYNTMKTSSPLNRFYKKNREKETGEIHLAGPHEMYPYGFDPTFYPYSLEDPMYRKKPATIFVANGGDLFGAWIPDSWINQVLTVIRQCSQHTFILLTKNWGRLYNFKFPDNAWVGVSRECGDRKWHNMAGIKAKTKFVSFEPLHSGFDYDSQELDGYRRIDLIDINFIIIGAETGPRAEQTKPKREWVMTLMISAKDQGIPVWMKDNLAPEVFDKSELIHELPNKKRGQDEH